MRLRRSALTLVQLLLIVGAAVVGALTATLDSWSWASLLVIAMFTATSELMSTQLDAEALASGSLLGIILVAVVYGGGPAAALGVLLICVGWLHSRESGRQFRNNVINSAWFPMLTALAFHRLSRGIGSGDPRYYLVVLAAFFIGLVVNVGIVACGTNLWAGPTSVLRAASAMLRPVLAAELASAVLAVAAVWVVHSLHLIGLAMLGIVLVIFQYLLSELLTSRRRADQLRRIATTDELTGLGNRERFHHVIAERIARTWEGDAGFPVMLMDLDRFKEINDTLGHSYGDQMLRDLGPRLQTATGAGGFVARLGGDEFGIVPGEDCGDDAVALEAVVARLLAAVSEPFVVDGLALEIGASVGVSRFPDDGADSHALMRCADIAMYVAKDAQTDFKFYSAGQNEHSMQRLSVLSDIRRALDGDEIVAHFQPIVDLEDRSVIGAEALVRWNHPEHGLIPPGAFVQTVEQSGLIGPLTRRVLEQSISQCADWRRAGREMSVAVNLSVRNLLDGELPHDIERMLADHSVPASALQLEITESMIMSDPERALATVSRLSNLGVRLSVDDFGTGYSSLANLRRLPIDELKIDRSFVSPMLEDESDLIIVRSTINLGHDLGLRIIAEGVEDEGTLERLATLGCDLAQGFHLSRPMPAPAFDAWLTTTPSPAAPAPSHAAGWATAGSALVVASPAP